MADTQGDLFRPLCAKTTAHQGTLFDNRGPRESDRSCPECGEPLVTTASGYLCCAKGHGRLLPQDGGEERSGSMFQE